MNCNSGSPSETGWRLWIVILVVQVRLGNDYELYFWLSKWDWVMIMKCNFGSPSKTGWQLWIVILVVQVKLGDDYEL